VSGYKGSACEDHTLARASRAAELSSAFCGTLIGFASPVTCTDGPSHNMSQRGNGHALQKQRTFIIVYVRPVSKTCRACLHVTSSTRSSDTETQFHHPSFHNQ
jgi:hypothetical protein